MLKVIKVHNVLITGLLANALMAEPQPVVSADLSAARTHFRRHEYKAALLSVEPHANEQSLMIAAESSFRLGDYKTAKEYYSKLYESLDDATEKKKVGLRLFDIDLLSGDIESAKKRYESYQKPVSIISYGLGKALFDRGEEEVAQSVLLKVAPDSEFYLASRYILAAIEMDRKKPSELSKLFKEIEGLPIISVEDHAIHDLAILAQMRIFSDAGRLDLAQNALSRLNTHSAYYATAIYELSSAYIERSELARAGIGPFSGYPDANKKIEEEKSLENASKLIGQFRKAQEIDSKNLNLLAVMAELLGKAKRYDEAHVAYDRLFEGYQEQKDELASSELWQELRLDAAKDLKIDKDVPKELLDLRRRLQESRQQILELKEQGQNDLLISAENRQNELENNYIEIARSVQAELLASRLLRLNEQVAQSEYKRAQLVLNDLRDVKKQLGVAQEFQTQKIELFESSLKAIDKGGAK